MGGTEGEAGCTGGCQCGAVRYRVRGPLGRPVICHCRMCQKHFGSLFSVLVAVKGHIEWTRGQLSYFRSSATVRRGFCQNCGTPMAFHSEDGIEIAVATFDEPSTFKPEIQVFYAERIPWVETIFNAPVRDLAKDDEASRAVISLQHPDHEMTDGRL